MKKFFRSLSILTVVILGIACDNLLSVDTPSKFNGEFVFGSEDYADNVMLGAYSLMGKSEYHQIEYVYSQNTDVECNYSCKAAPQNNRLDMFSLRGGLLANFSYNKTIWQNIYSGIDRCNLVIEGLAGKEGAGFKAILAEAYTMRAYRYLQAVQLWGDVPYFDYSAAFDRELDLPKSDHNVIFSKELQNLVNHQADMKWSEELDEGIERMNREFCIGLIARIALSRAGYGMTREGVMKKADDYLDPAMESSLQVKYTIEGETKIAVTSRQYYEMAADYCKLLIRLKDRELTPDFSQIFMNENQYLAPKGSEVLFEVPHGANSGQVGYSNGANYSSGTQGSSGVQVKFCPAYVFTFDESDTRLLGTVGLTKWSGDIAYADAVNGFCCAKWNRKYAGMNLGPDSKEGTGINFPVMRYSDILLMLAEAENEVSGAPTPLAKEQLKKVRRRAFPQECWADQVESYVDRLNTKEEFFKAIVDERAWEFGGEALRKWDLVRWNIYGHKINAAKDFIIKAGRASQPKIVELEPELEAYTGYADYAYYTKQNNKLIFLNINRKLASPPKTTISSSNALWGKEDWNGGYAKMNMCYSFCTLNKTNPSASTYSEYYDLMYYGYDDPTGESAVPYLMAINQQTIDNSKYLTNDGYGHVLSAN